MKPRAKAEQARILGKKSTPAHVPSLSKFSTHVAATQAIIFFVAKTKLCDATWHWVWSQHRKEPGEKLDVKTSTRYCPWCGQAIFIMTNVIKDTLQLLCADI